MPSMVGKSAISSVNLRRQLEKLHEKVVLNRPTPDSL